MLALSTEDGERRKRQTAWKGRLGTCLQIYTALVMTALLILAISIAPAAHDAARMVQDNKERVNRTITSVLHVSEQAEEILLDIRSFLEFRLTDALCSSSIIRKIMGSFCTSEDTRRAVLDAWNSVSVVEALLSSTICTERTAECALLNELHQKSILGILNKSTSQNERG